MKVSYIAFSGKNVRGENPINWRNGVLRVRRVLNDGALRASLHHLSPAEYSRPASQVWSGGH